SWKIGTQVCEESPMILHRRLALSLIIALVCGVEMLGPPAPVATPLQTCTAQNIRGFPISGVVCGGSPHALACTPGAIYRCRSGPLGQCNNCTLSQACAVGCLTGPTTGMLSDGSFAGSPPLTLSTSNTPGGTMWTSRWNSWPVTHTMPSSTWRWTEG